MFLATKVHVAVAGQLLLRLSHECVQASFDVGQAFTDVAHQSGVERFGQEMCAASVSDVAIGWVVLEEFGFGSIAMIAEGCIMARICHTNNCPVGVASQREDLRQRFPGIPEHVVKSPVQRQSFLASRPVADSRSIASRGTRGYWAMDCESKKIAFLKDAWRTNVDGFEVEGDILSSMKGQSGIPSLMLFLQ